MFLQLIPEHLGLGNDLAKCGGFSLSATEWKRPITEVRFVNHPVPRIRRGQGLLDFGHLYRYPCH